MASAFNLTAQLNLRGPSNVGKIVSDIRKQIGTIQGTVDLKINATAIRNVTQLNSTLQSLNKNLIDVGTNANQAASAVSAFVNSANAVNRSTSTTANNTAKVTSSIDKLATSSKTTAKAVSVARTEIEEFGRQSALAVRRFAAFSAATGAIFGIGNAFRKALGAFVEFDKQFIKIQQVTDKTGSQLASLTKEITTLSVGLGIASSDLINVAQTLAQAGLSARDTEKALRALALSDLAPSFDNINDTVEGSIALMRQFGISAGELESALGSVNAVAAGFAVEASDLIAAIQRTGGVFATASKGVSEGTDALNEFLAVFTSVRQTTRESAETIATGLRTIFTRIQREDTIEALREYGVQLTDAEGKFVGAYRAVELLSDGLSKIDPRDIRFSRIVEELGGFRQIGKVIPLIQQFAVAQQALKVAQQGQGSLAKDALTAQLSLANQIAKVREEFLGFVRDIGSSDTFQTLAKGALSLTSGLIKIAGALRGVLPILAILGISKGASALTQFGAGFIGGIKKNATGGGGGGSAPTTAAAPGSTGGPGGILDDSDNTAALNRLSDILENNMSAIESLSNNIDGLINALGSINNFSTELANNTASLVANTASIDALTAAVTSLNLGGGTTLNTGGKVMAFARGGVVPGRGNRDTVPAMLQPGEFVIRKKAVETIGANNLHGMNKYGSGGSIRSGSYGARGRKKFAKGGPAIASIDSFNENDILDGDTFDAMVTPKVEPYKARFRMEGYDAYETNGKKSKITSEKWKTISKYKSNAGIQPDIASDGSYKISPDTVVGRGGLTADSAGNKATDQLSKVISSKKSNLSSLVENISETNVGFGRLALNLGRVVDEQYTTGRYADEEKGYAFGGKVQKFAQGGKIQRNLGYIDYDVIANEANAAIVEEGMKKSGVKGPRLYAEYLTDLAVKARKEQKLDKLRAIYGVAGSGKTTLARGQGTDVGTLRETTRFPILTPEDIEKATEVLILTSSVSQDKLEGFLSEVDRAYTLSSTTAAEKERVRAQRTSRDTTGVGLEGRKPGTTGGVDTSTAIGEAMLEDTLGKRSVVLGRSTSGRLRQKKGNELVEIIKKRIGFTWGGYAPTTLGHESIVDSAAAYGIPPEDFIALVGANEGVEPGKEDSYRTAIFDQDARVLLAKAGFGAKGATVLPKDRDLEVPQGFDIGEGPTGRQRVILPASGSIAFAADKTEKDLAKYIKAGYEAVNLPRSGGISGTLVRKLIEEGNLGELQKVLSPGVYDMISKNIGRIQNRAGVLPSIIQQVQASETASLAEIQKQIDAVGIKRIDKETVAKDPAYAAQAAVLTELRKKRDKIKGAARFEPYRLLAKLAAAQPDKYGLDFTQSPTAPSLGSMGVVEPVAAPAKQKATVSKMASTTKAKTKAAKATTVRKTQASMKMPGSELISEIGGMFPAIKALEKAGIDLGTDKKDERARRMLRSDKKAKQVLIDAINAKYAEFFGGISQQGLSFGAVAMQGNEYTNQAKEITGGLKQPTTVSITGRLISDKFRQMLSEDISGGYQSAIVKPAQKLTISQILEDIIGGNKLISDFDKVINYGADIIPSSPGAPMFSEFSDLDKVREALGSSKLSPFGESLVDLVKSTDSADLLNRMFINTARSQATAPLIKEWLDSVGLPIPLENIYGVGGANVGGSSIPRLKAAIVQTLGGGSFVDDDPANVGAVDEAMRSSGLAGKSYLMPLEATAGSEVNTAKGVLFQNILANLGAFRNPDKQSIDFPNGLGSQAAGLVNDGGMFVTMPTDAKYTLSGPGDLVSNITNYLKAQGYMAGGTVKAPKQTFGTGEFPFPKRISNAYFKEIDKILEAQRNRDVWDINPKDERIIPDEALAQSGYDMPFDKGMFLTTFKDKISKNNLFQRMGQFARFIGLPGEDLSAILPQQIDFGAPGMLGGALFAADPSGPRTRGLQGVDLSQYGFSERDKQDVFGYGKLLEEKQKAVKKVLKTPVKTFEDGSFQYDSAAAQSLWGEIDELKGKISAKGKLQRDASEKARAARMTIAETTGRGGVSVDQNLRGQTQNYDVLYHELTHQLFQSMRVRNAESFTKYKDRVNSLFAGDNDDLAEAFDSLAEYGYKSADVVYGRSYKQSALEGMALNIYRKANESKSQEDKDFATNVAKGLTSSQGATSARAYRPINPNINSLLLKGNISQDVIDKMEDNGKEEFLTTLVQNAPKLDSNLSGILDSTLTDLLGNAGIQRQRFFFGGKVDPLAKKYGLTQKEFLEQKKIADSMGLDAAGFEQKLKQAASRKQKGKDIKFGLLDTQAEFMASSSIVSEEKAALEEFLKVNKLAAGGKIRLYHGSTTGTDDVSLKSFKEKGALADIAQGYGQGAGFYVFSGKEIAKKQAIDRSKKGLGSFTTFSGDTAGKPMVLTFEEMLDPATWDLDYELNKGSIVKWLYDNYDTVKDVLAPQEGVAGIKGLISPGQDSTTGEYIMSKGLRAQSAKGDTQALYAGTSSNLAEGAILGQIMGRLQEANSEFVAQFENQFFKSKSLASGAWDDLALKYVGSTPLMPIDIETFAKGGSAKDTVPALLTPGEFVINKNAAQKIGYNKLNKLNHADKIQGYNKGGAVGYIQKFAAGGTPNPFAPSLDMSTIVAALSEGASRVGVTLEQFVREIKSGTDQIKQDNMAQGRSRAEARAAAAEAVVGFYGIGGDLENASGMLLADFSKIGPQVLKTVEKLVQGSDLARATSNPTPPPAAPPSGKIERFGGTDGFRQTVAQNPQAFDAIVNSLASISGEIKTGQTRITELVSRRAELVKQGADSGIIDRITNAIQEQRKELATLASSRTSQASAAGAGAGLEMDVAFSITEYIQNFDKLNVKLNEAAAETKKAVDAEITAIDEEKKAKSKAILERMKQISGGTEKDRYDLAKEAIESGDYGSARAGTADVTVGGQIFKKGEAAYDPQEAKNALERAQQAVAIATAAKAEAESRTAELSFQKTETYGSATSAQEVVNRATPEGMTAPLLDNSAALERARADKLAAEATEVFATRAKQAGVSVVQFQANLKKQVVDRALQVQKGRVDNAEDFRATSFARSTDLKSGDSKIAAEAERSIRRSLEKSLDGFMPEEEIKNISDEYIARLKSMTSIETTSDIIEGFDDLKKALADSTTDATVFDESIKDMAASMGIAEEEVRKLMDVGVAALEAERSFKQSADAIAKVEKAATLIGATLASLGTVLSDVIKSAAGGDSRGGALASAGVEAFATTTGAVITGLGQIGPALVNAKEGLDKFGPMFGQAGARIAGQLSGSISSILPMLTNPYVLAGAAVAAVAVGALAAAKAMHNAAKEFDKSQAAKRVENAMERVGRAFDDFEKDVRRVDLLGSIQKDLESAGMDVARGIRIDAEVPTAYWVNLFDALSGGAEAAQRSTILEKKGVGAYLQTTEAFQDPTAVLGGLIAGIPGYLLGNSISNTTGNASAAKQRASDVRENYMIEMAPDMAKQQSASFKPVADATLRLFESKLKTGTSMQDVLGELKDATGAPTQLAQNIARANPAIQEQILNIQASNNLSDQAKQSMIDEIVAREANYRSLLTLEAAQKAIDFEKMQDAMDRFVTSLQRMYDNMDRAIAKTSFELDGMSRSLELSNAALSGQAKAGETNLKSINILRNPQAYSTQSRQGAVDQAAGFFGSESDTMRSMLQIGPMLEQTVMSTMNRTLKEDPGASDAKLAGNIRVSLDKALDGLGLPPDLSTKMSKEVQSAFAELRQKGDEDIGFDELAEKVPALSNSIQSAKVAQEVAIRALEFYQKNVNEYAKAMNDAVDMQISANNHLRQANDIEIKGRMQLAQTFGRSISLQEQQNNQRANIRSLTGGPTAPFDIRNNINDLNATRAAQQAAADTAAQAGPSGRDQFIAMQQNLKNTNISLRENYQALKSLAESGDMASAALSKINEIQQKTQAGVGLIEKFVTSSPEEISKFNKALANLDNNMRGVRNASTAEDRSATLQAFNMIAPFLGDSAEQNTIKANVLETMLQESGVGISGTFATVLDSLRNPEQNPEMAAAVQFYDQSIKDQAEANRALASLEQKMADNTADIAADKFSHSLAATKLNFESQQLVDINNEVKGLRKDVQGNKNAGVAPGLAFGGVVYASEGQQVQFKPKGTDTVPAMLTPGEFVVNRSATAKNLPLLQSINNGYKNGGKVSYYQDGGLVIDPAWTKRDPKKDAEDRGKTEYQTDETYPILSASVDKEYIDTVGQNRRGEAFYVASRKTVRVKNSWYATSDQRGALGLGDYIGWGEGPLPIKDANTRPIRGFGYEKIRVKEANEYPEFVNVGSRKPMATDYGWEIIPKTSYIPILGTSDPTDANIAKLPIRSKDIKEVRANYKKTVENLKSIGTEEFKDIKPTTPPTLRLESKAISGGGFEISGLTSTRDEPSDITIFTNGQDYNYLKEPIRDPGGVIGIREMIGVGEIFNARAQAVAGWENFYSQGSRGYGKGGYINYKTSGRESFRKTPIDSKLEMDQNIKSQQMLYELYNDALLKLSKDSAKTISSKSLTTKKYMADLEALYNKNIFDATFEKDNPFTRDDITDYPITLYNIEPIEWSSILDRNNDIFNKDGRKPDIEYSLKNFIPVSLGKGKKRYFPWTTSSMSADFRDIRDFTSQEFGKEKVNIIKKKSDTFRGTGNYSANGGLFNIPYDLVTFGRTYNEDTMAFDNDSLTYLIVKTAADRKRETLAMNPFVDSANTYDRLYFKDLAELENVVQSATPLIDLKTGKMVPLAGGGKPYSYSGTGLSKVNQDVIDTIKPLIPDETIYPLVLTNKTVKEKVSFEAKEFEVARNAKLKNIQTTRAEALQKDDRKVKLEEDEEFTSPKRVTLARLAWKFAERLAAAKDPDIGLEFKRSKLPETLGDVATPALEASQDAAKLSLEGGRETPGWAKRIAWSRLFGNLFSGKNPTYFKAMGFGLRYNADATKSDFSGPKPENWAPGVVGTRLQYWNKYKDKDVLSTTNSDNLFRMLLQRELNLIRGGTVRFQDRPDEQSAASLSSEINKTVQLGTIEIDDDKKQKERVEIKEYDELVDFALKLPFGEQAAVFPDWKQRQKYLGIGRDYFEKALDNKGNRAFTNTYVKALDPPTVVVPDFPDISFNNIKQLLENGPVTGINPIETFDQLKKLKAWSGAYGEPKNLRDYYKLLDNIIGASDDANTSTLKRLPLEDNLASALLGLVAPATVAPEIQTAIKTSLDDGNSIAPDNFLKLNSTIQDAYKVLTGNSYSLPEGEEVKNLIKSKLALRAEKLKANPDAFKPKEEQAQYAATGGLIYASGGSYVNFAPRGTDTVPAMLTPGEFVINRDSSAKYRPVLEAINSGNYNRGGIVNYLNNGGLISPNYYRTGGEAKGFDFAGFMRSLTSTLVSNLSQGIQKAFQNNQTNQQNNSNGVSSIDTSVLDRLNEFTNRLKSVTDTLAALEAIPSQITVTGRHDVNIVINGDSALNQLKPDLQKLVMSQLREKFDQLVNANQTPGAPLINPFNNGTLA